MSLQDSPSLEYYKDGYRDAPDPNKGKKRTWIIIGALGALVVVLGVFAFLQSGGGVLLSGKGTVTGYAVDEEGNPIRVEVLIFDTNILEVSDEEGYFIIRDVPAGKQSVIVAADEIASEVEVYVVAGTENTVGTVTVPTNLNYLLDD
jgi:hypothetical protein